MSNEIMIRMEQIVKTYYIGQPNELEILHGINLDVKRGEFVSIVGESGSGKSTLMNIMGILDRQTSGNYFLEGEDVNSMDDTVRSVMRNEKIGFVFQNFNLIPRANALKNVTLPLMYSEQRIAIARAMINDPSIILADEPTGALDSQTGHMIMDIFHKLHEEQGKTVVLITHSKELAAETERIVTLNDGMIVSDSRKTEKGCDLSGYHKMNDGCNKPEIGEGGTGIAASANTGRNCTGNPAWESYASGAAAGVVPGTFRG